ncbi:hypothetical protein CS063_00750 [Sporanaerobium hydrogeniformans]|uniref:Uncharacterized protein n=1 Tax=Sporanaerobium hydrogeniformans TaxID=3072179 RepID=A0AC61DFQ1_9FIRM|nr:hypothetical protein [Sporanaerobium hydrogeniformans]PHV72039.1 hypothetical protein CS063_00750 [Sporanaerobium hydrogeniformans]
MKLMSVLEKYNLVEKTDNEVLPEDITTAPISVATEEQPAPTMPSPLPEPEEKVVVQAPRYTANLSLEEIYSHYHLSAASSTDTIFMLEGLLAALPESLTEEVLKDTVKNIITVSHLNLEGLLKDGEERLQALHALIKDYTAYTREEIATYREQIAELTASINQLQEKIKGKELLLKGQDTIIQEETARIEKIVSFFKK